MAETFGFHLRDAQVGLRVLLVDLEGLFEQTVRFFGVEALEEQMAPADAVIGVLGILLHQIAELVVGFLIALDAPESLGAEIRIGARGQIGQSKSALRLVCRDGARLRQSSRV